MTYAIIESERAPGILDERSAVAPSVLASKRADPDFVRVLAAERRTLGTRLDFHHVRGRLRLKAEALRGDPARLDALCRAFGAMAGVHRATCNHLTGSVLAAYDSSVLSPDAVAWALTGCCSAAVPVGKAAPSTTECISAKVVEWLLERLVVVLIAAMA